MRFALFVLAVVAAALLALAGCGGGDSGGGGGGSDTPEGTVQAFYDAAADNDADNACALFTSDPGDSGNLLAASASALPSLGDTCAEKVADTNSSNPGLLEKVAADLSLETTEESADEAKVELKVPEGAFTTVVVLTKSDGGWKIEQAGNEQFVK